MINILDEGLVSHLAAGEVIDRPSSVIRECIDNSIDADASKISIECTDGGKNLIVIDDNGNGIDKEDLSVIASPHATSKIRVLDDIYNISTMGFRGEALFSLVSVGDLSIESNGYGVRFDNFKRSNITRACKEKGTRIELKGLFSSLPARLSFLSSAQTENTRCKSLIEEKSLPFCNIEFSYSNDGKELLHFYKESETERVAHFLQSSITSQIKCVASSGDDFSIKLYYLSGDVRRDKKKIKIYVNKRAVVDSYLTSALIHAFSRTMPGGMYPSIVIFIENSPELTDFNVHPQKRECRLRNAHDIHHAIATIFNNSFFEEERRLAEMYNTDKEESAEVNNTFLSTNTSADNFEKTVDIKSDDIPENPFKNNNTETIEHDNIETHSTYLPDRLSAPCETSSAPVKTQQDELFENTAVPSFTYIGQLWKEFLLYTVNDTLYIIDQHAAAERIMFDRLRKHSDVQELLFPITLELESTISEALDKNKDMFIQKGIGLIKQEPGLWTVTSLPSCCKNSEREILSLIENANDTELDQKIYAIIACHNSIRQGVYLSEKDAVSLIKDTLSLDEKVCPHGRVFTLKISKEELEKLVLR